MSDTQKPDEPATGKTEPVVHTPGPWTLKKKRCGQGCCDDLHEVLAKYEDDSAADPGRPIATVNGGNAVWLREGETDGNAALISAAPELLAACKALLVMRLNSEQPRKLDAAITWRENDELAEKMAKDAIAKATGLFV